ncbi:MAG: hypothetical protein ACJAVV_002406 [Alphaproteobacteria bacterium]|jgi:hypothetical protein
MRLFKLAAIVSAFYLSGCAHQIQLNPKTDEFVQSSAKSDATVGYHITDIQREMKVTTPGGGGDKVTYTPYKDTETVLFQVLSNKFKDVFLVKSMSDETFIKENEIKLIFVPTITTNSSSSSMFTWAPTKFMVTLDVKAVDASGNTVWEDSVYEEGNAEFNEFKSDFSLSARRATEAAFLKLAEKLEQSDTF